MDMNLTGKQRLWVVIAIAWILFWLFVAEPWEFSDEWKGFLAVGIGPVALTLAIIWIRRGFQNDKRARDSQVQGPSK